MPLTMPVGGVTQPDVAVMHTGEHTFLCFVWADLERSQIGTAIYLEGVDGQRTLLKTEHLGTLHGCFSPKVIARRTGSLFVCQYAEFEDPSTYRLMRATIDPLDLVSSPSWTITTVGTMNSDMSHDLDAWTGSTDDYYCYAWKNASGSLTVETVKTDGSGATTTTATIVVTPAQFIAVWGDTAATPGLWVAYHDATSQNLHVRRFSLTGLSTTNTLTTPISGAGWLWFRGGFCSYIEGQSGVLVCERQLQVPTNIHDREITCVAFSLATGLASSSPATTPWLTMLSRPIARKHESGKSDVFVLAGFKSRLVSPNEFSQMTVFVVDMQIERMLVDGNIQARPVAQLGEGAAMAVQGDSASIGLTQGHCTHGAIGTGSGPGLRACVFPGIAYGRLRKFQGSLYPSNPMVVGWRFHHEDPWLRHSWTEDSSLAELPGQDATFYDGPFARVQAQSVEIGKGLVRAGSTPSIYDGKEMVEIGFSWWPEVLTATHAVGPGNISAGTRQYTAIYEWHDNRGQVHRSAPAIPVTVVATGTGTTTLTITNQTLTWKMGTGAWRGHAITIVIYRTTAGGTVFYEVTRRPNTTDALRTTFVDSLLDAIIATNAILPHQLREGQWFPLENFQPPPAQTLAAWKNRVWLACTETLWYSHEVLPDAGSVNEAVPEFHPVCTYRIDDGGEITGLAAMGYGLVVFKSDRVFILYGDGNDRNGTGANLDHKRVGFGIGCMTPKSIVVGPMGCFFQSEKGFYLLSLQEELAYIGAPVEDVLRRCGNVRAVQLVEDRHQVRVVAEEMNTAAGGTLGTCVVLVYDYLFNVWSTWNLRGDAANDETEYGVIDAATWSDYAGERAMAVLRQAGTVEIEDFGATPWQDGPDGSTVTIPATVETQWLKLDQTQGWWRCRSILVHIQRRNNARCTVRLAYDYAAFDSADEVSVFVDTDEPVIVRPRRQSFSALKVQVSDEDEPGKTENFAITSIAIEYRPKPGRRRVSARNTAR